MIIQGDVLLGLAAIKDNSVHCCVTSPPYWGLRDYGVEGQLGLEKTPQEYIAKMVEVFREVRRVLRKDGTCWLNVGDSYAAQGGGQVEQTVRKSNDYVNSGQLGSNGSGTSRKPPDGLKPKDLCLIPFRLAIALQEPWLKTVIKEERWRLWLAGVIDTEGSIGLRKQISSGENGKKYNDTYIPYLSVSMSDKELLQKCVEITGYGNLTIKQKAGTTDNRQIKSRFDYNCWRLDGNKAVELIREIYPYLLIKQKQAALICAVDDSNKEGRPSKSQPLPIDVVEQREYLYQSIKALNQRKPIDIPSWIKEPGPVYEPGWYVRSDIIWAKPNPMPESVTDRPTKSHEYLFLLTKSAKYYFDQEAVKEPQNGNAHSKGKKLHPPIEDAGIGHKDWHKYTPDHILPSGRNIRTVWTIPTQPTPEAHFATFPEALIVPCIKAGCPEGGTVLDPFFGSGTTGIVCKKLNRQHIGIELNPEYVAISQRRTLKACGGLF